MLKSVFSLFRGRQAVKRLDRMSLYSLEPSRSARLRHRGIAFTPSLPIYDLKSFNRGLALHSTIRCRTCVPARRPRSRVAPALLQSVNPSESGENEAGSGNPNPAVRKLTTLPQQGEDGLPIIKEDDLEEQFVRSSGPGGQKVNKTASCVVLKHLPSGVMVRCQETRSQMKNRQLARKILRKKLDDMIRGKESLAAQELSKARARKAKRRRKSVKKHFKSRRDKAMMDDRMANF